MLLWHPVKINTSEHRIFERHYSNTNINTNSMLERNRGVLEARGAQAYMSVYYYLFAGITLLVAVFLFT